MKSYTILRNLYGSFTNDSGSANLTLGDQRINDNIRNICSMKDWPFLEKSRTITTVASQQLYALPYDCDLVRAVAVTVSGTTHVPKLCPSQEMWDSLNSSVYTSDTPEYYFVFAGKVGIFPKPTSAGNTITITQKSRVADLSIADYTTGTIVSVAASGVAVVGSGTSWTVQMAGRYIRITHLDTANTGDGVWYEIASVTDTTHLTLVRAYGGTAIAAGSAAYNIGQMSLLPEAFQDLPVKLAASDYWGLQGHPRATFYQNQYDRGIAALVATYSSPTTNMVIDDGMGNEGVTNPNLFVTL